MRPGEKNKTTLGSSDRVKLLDVCRLLNRKRAKYLLIGGWACNLHGLIRGTKDIDLLIPRDVANTKKILDALGGLTWGIARELDAEEVARKPFTIVGDTPRVDLLTQGGGRVRYEDAAPTALKVVIDGVRVPYVDVETLIRTKSTDRLQDKVDIERLRQFLKKK
ncbi:hypothetical protein FBR05_04730 [Deltaproteobacteria bacterium PRO3]|nr:hypothetical protein [Deltaproteobacteria bacterium PRO3]